MEDSFRTARFATNTDSTIPSFSRLSRLQANPAQPDIWSFESSPEAGDFVYLSAQDVRLPPVHAEDRDGVRHDLADSALLSGVRSVDLTGEGQQDAIPGSANLGKVRVIGQTTL